VIIKKIPIKDLSSSKDQVRTTFNEEKLEALALSIKKQGQEVPIKVRPNGKGYEIIYGHRRTEASRRAGLKTMIAIVEDVDDTEALRKQVVENEYRERVSDIERARGYLNLSEKIGCSNIQLALRLGISSQYLGTLLNALKAVDEGIKVYNRGDSGDVNLHHTQMVNRIHGNLSEKREVADKINSEELGQLQIQEVVKAYNSASTTKEKKRVLKVKHPRGMGVTFNQAIRAVDISDKRTTEKRRQAEITDDPIVKNYNCIS
jgi:ParB family chromosome partitioning protein